MTIEDWVFQSSEEVDAEQIESSLAIIVEPESSRAPNMKPMPKSRARYSARKVYISLTAGHGDRAIAGLNSDVECFKEEGNEIKPAEEMALEDALDHRDLPAILETGIGADVVADLRGLKLATLKALPGMKPAYIADVRKCLRRYGLRLNEQE